MLFSQWLYELCRGTSNYRAGTCDLFSVDQQSYSRLAGTLLQRNAESVVLK